VSAERDILNVDEAAELLGVSVKTFNKVLHGQNLPARKIGREWKFSRRALIDWVGAGRSQDYYRDADGELANANGPEAARGAEHALEKGTQPRRGWRLELD
jgi:excisionase family DNA binding protein